MKRKERSPETANNVGGESSSTSNTLNSTPAREYDVFLSFYGKDTRLKFTDHLYDALRRDGINAFRDNEGIERGEVISDQLDQAIKESSCAIVVLSENYADSKWCLKELQMILKCWRELDQRVFPIFYDVDPSDVKHQRKKFGVALDRHEKEPGQNEAQNWRKALSEIGSIAGWDTRQLPEAELIKGIVETVKSHLRSKLLSFDDGLVGIESRVRDMETLLKIGLDDKRVVGIWGMGGVGKTTLARVVSKKISKKFDGYCFIANVRDTLKKVGGLVSLQEKLLSDLKIKDMQIANEFEGKDMIRKYLSNKKVLLVLDDVDDELQLKNLAESPDWFGEGSRIIITTRYRHVLTSSRVEGIYGMETMKEDESLQLFSKKAFKEDYPKEDYLKLSKSVVEYAGGLPLALEVLGSFFCGKSKKVWIDALDRLKQSPEDGIVKVLQISYDGLKEEEKTIFLDIACFFKGWPKKEVTQILKSCDLHPIIGISVLIEKALLVETEDCTLEMHDLIEELGRHIVHQESPHVCKRSRLWKFKDIKEVLENNKGSEAIQAIAIKENYKDQDRIKVHPEAFSKMSSIRLLLMDTVTNSRIILPSGFKLPGTLKVVQWSSFPFEALPLETSLNELVHVNLQHGRIKQLWNVIQPMKMKFIDLSYSKYLIETPDFSGVPCLEHLRLRWCKSLVKVHPSLGELKELVEVNLHGCLNLEILPRKLKTNSLLKLDLGGREKVVVLPKFGEGMENLSYLDVSCTAITRIPKSFGSLTSIGYLNLSGCKICNLHKFSLKIMPLTELYLSGCGLNDGSIPDDFGSLSSLIVLDLSHNDFVNLSTACFSSLFRLLLLSLDYCGKLKSLPRLPPRLTRLNASHCYSMEPLSSDRQIWNLVASLDHEYRGQTEYEYVISDGEYDDSSSKFNPIELEHLPLRDFFAIVPGCKIPSWFPNKDVPNKDGPSSNIGCDFEIEVEIPPCFRHREWFGVVVCLHLSNDFDGMISWSSKTPEDDDYIHKEWLHVSNIQKGNNHHLHIMVLKLNENTCWQHLEAGGNSLHIKLYVYNYVSDSLVYWTSSIPMSKLECGWRVICKEDIQKWCNDNDLNRQLAAPHDKVKLPSRLLDEFVGSVYGPWYRDVVM